MSMIKCPECGHIISDKAPVCPSCGVEIAGKVVKCPECGTEYFAAQKECPNCHHVLQEQPAAPVNTQQPEVPQRPSAVPHPTEAPVPQYTPEPPKNEEPPAEGKKKNNYTLIAVIIAVVIIVCAAGVYMMKTASGNKEEEAYEYAMNSKDAGVLQSYLDTYTDAPEAHRDSIEAHLALLNQADQEWTNAMVSGSKAALQQYINSHPNSPFTEIALQKIDSIDWATANTTNTVEAYETYLEEHPNGAYTDDADDKIKNINTKTVQPEEKQMISSLFGSFFLSINNKDADALQATVNSLLTSFLGKRDATRSDVVTFMNKIYKSDVERLDWEPSGNYQISKKEIGDEQYEYTVVFSAVENITKTDATTSQNHFRINAKVNPDGRITEMNMTKIIK